jgi:uroporphyrinogen-III decarboxylase
MAKEMNSTSRVLCALAHGKPDRPPVTISRNLFDRSAWFSKDESYAALLDFARKNTDVIYKKEDFGSLSYRYYYPRFHRNMDVTTETIDSSTVLSMKTPKGILRSVRKAVPRTVLNPVVESFIKEKADFERLLSIPYDPQFDSDGFIREEKAIRGRGVVCLVTNSPAGSLYDLCQPEQFAIWSVTEKDFLKRMFDWAYEIAYGELKAALSVASGNGLEAVAFYFHGHENAIPPMHSPAFYDEFVFPYDRKLFELVKMKGYRVIVHCHGKVNNFIGRFLDAGADATHPLEPPPQGDVLLSEVRRRYGDKLCMIGNIEYEDLAQKTEEEIENLVKGALYDGAREGAFILSPCCGLYESPLPHKTALNYIRFIRAGVQYGKELYR